MATRSKSIQFFDANAVLEVFQQLDIPSFAIWHDTQLMFPHESEDMEEALAVLENYLESLKESPTIYSIRFYKNLNGNDISTKTDYNGSFNFRLKNPEELGRSAVGGHFNYNTVLESKINALTLAIDEMRRERDEDPEPPEDPKQGIGQINAFLDHPLVKFITDKIFNVVQQSTQQQPEQHRRPAISGINEQQAPAAGTDYGPLTLDQSIAILKQADPALHVHLAKLAALSQQDPDSFNFLLQTLDRM